MDHHLKCSSCEKDIVGIRYQCLNCPSSPTAYNLCSQCEPASFKVHPFPHVFLKLNRPVDNPLEVPDPVAPVLYNVPKAPEMTQEWLDTAATRRAQDLVHPQTWCDMCMTQIKGGPWFHCAQCHSDLCEEHEVEHDPTHACLVLKSDDVDVQTMLGLYNPELQRPDEAKPLLNALYTTQP